MRAADTQRTIHAPIETVFHTVADIEGFSEAVPHITNIEFLTEQRTGVGTRFRETRKMGKRSATTELEVTEYVPNERVRIVSDAGGTIWDTVFSVQQKDDGAVELKMVMDARPYKLLARVGNKLIKGMIARAIEDDMDAVKRWCDSQPE